MKSRVLYEKYKKPYRFQWSMRHIYAPFIPLITVPSLNEKNNS